MIRLSSKIIKAGTIGLAAMMMFTSVVFADEAPDNIGIASYDPGEAAETSVEETPGEAGIAAWLSGDTEETAAAVNNSETKAEPSSNTNAQTQTTGTTFEPEEGEHASIIAHEKRVQKYDSLYKNYVFPDLDPGSDSYINVREKASADSELIGKLYAKTAARVLETVDGEDGPWFKISSGSVTGYVKAYYCITGSTAEEMAKNYGVLVAVINTESLRLRAKASLESEQIAILSEDDVYPVTGEEGAFIKVEVDDVTEGFVLEEYVTLKVIYKKAVSIEEERAAIQRQIEAEQEAERARKEAEEAAERARREAEQEEEENNSQSSNNNNENKSSNNNNENKSSNNDSNKSTNKDTSKDSNKSENKSSSKDNSKDSNKSENKSSSKDSNKSSSKDSNKSSSKDSDSNKSSSKSGDTSALRAAIVKYAKSFVGKLQYVYGGDSLVTGTDCSGFTKLIYAKFGISLPRSSRAYTTVGKAVSSSNMRPGDILYYGRHVAIYIGDGLIVHAANSRLDVKISKWNYRTPITIRNVIGD